jgi:hypothetical protein
MYDLKVITETSSIGGMLASTSIIILLLVTSVAADTTAAGTQPDLNAYFKLLKDIKDHRTAGRAGKLLWDVVEALKSYLCDVGSEECNAVKEYIEEHDLEKDENTAQAVKNGLIADADEIFAKTHKSFMKLDTIRIALIAVICDNEPKECDFWR